jgi:hypothetical protein
VWKKDNKVGDAWQTTMKATHQLSAVASPEVAAGHSTFFASEDYKNQFVSVLDSGAGYSGIKHSEAELVMHLRKRLA